MALPHPLARLPRARRFGRAGRQLRAQAGRLASRARALAAQAHSFAAALCGPQPWPSPPRRRRRQSRARKRRSRRRRAVESGLNLTSRVSESEVDAEVVHAACPALYHPDSMEWLSADEFLSVAFCAGFDSTDVTWMDAFEAICWEHGCDPAVGVSKGAFLKLVNDAFGKRTQPTGVPASVTRASQEILVANRWPSPTTERLAAQHGWPKVAACSSIGSEEEYLAEFQELAVELGPATVEQLGLDEVGYSWARHVFEQLESIFLERRRPLVELPLHGLDVTRQTLRSIGSSALLLGSPQHSSLRTALLSRGDCQPLIRHGRAALPPPTQEIRQHGATCADEESGESVNHVNAGFRHATSSPPHDGERCYADACWRRPGTDSPESSTVREQAGSPPRGEPEEEGWNFDLYALHWDEGDPTETQHSQELSLSHSSCLD